MISYCFREVFTLCFSNKGSCQISIPFVVSPILHSFTVVSKFTRMCNSYVNHSGRCLVLTRLVFKGECLFNWLRNSPYHISISSSIHVTDWLNAKLLNSFDKSDKNTSSLNLLKHL